MSEKKISLWELYGTFAKIGSFTIGGGYAMIPLIEREIVDKKKWLDEKEFLDLLVIAQSAPGVMAINFSTLLGNRFRGKKGSLACALGSATPSFFIILLFAIFLTQYENSPLVVKIFKAVRPAVVALIAVPVFNLAKSAKLNWGTFWIPIVAALLIWKCGVSPIYIIIVAGIGGIVARMISDKRKKNRNKT